MYDLYKDYIGLSPHGESGLKLLSLAQGLVNAMSLPARGEWIEIAFYIVDKKRH